MKGTRRLVTILAPVVVVIVLGELHAHLVGHYPFTGTQRFLWTVAYIALLEFFAYLSGAFDVQRNQAGAVWAGVGAAVGGGVAISLIQLATGSLLLPRAVVGGTTLVLLPIYLAVAHSARRAQALGAGEDRVLAVVGPEEAAALDADIHRAPERSVRLVRVLHPSSDTTPSAEAGLDLVKEAEASRATVVVLDRDAQADEAVVAQAALLHGLGLRIRTLTVFYDEWLGKLPVAELERVSLMFDIQELHAPAYARTKRIVDLASALVGLVLLAVALPIVWIADRIGNPGPLLFRQTRVGKGGRTFTILKFRTMPPGRTESEWTAEDDPRLRTLARWMRRLHVDELPQVINILRGELSLVGPRPEQPHYVAELTQKIPFYDVRHLVLPGVTGWAQVKFPYGASVQDALEKLQYEFYYLRHQGPVLDARILARTVRTLVALKGR
jgi:lipopolysaccharide/colanic/teichoic acid biosynthesis glycosyltransferase